MTVRIGQIYERVTTGPHAWNEAYQIKIDKQIIESYSWEVSFVDNGSTSSTPEYTLLDPELYILVVEAPDTFEELVARMHELYRELIADGHA